MILIGNKVDIIGNKISNRIYWEEDNIRESNWDIWNKQDMNILRLIESNYLISNIHNDINRE
jgi:hypothetical protein